MDTHAILDRAVKALRHHGLTVQVLKQPQGAHAFRADGWLRVGKGNRLVNYVVEAKRAVTPSTLGAVLMQLRQVAHRATRPSLLLTDYVTPQVAETFRRQKQPFADAAGNAYLEGPGLFVFVLGGKLEEGRSALRTGKVLNTAGLKVLFALICEPPLADAPQRAIASAAGVALGAIPPVLADLHRSGHLLVSGRRRRLNATQRLLDTWTLDYARNLRTKTLVKTYVAPDFDKWPDWPLDRAQVRWGGEPAANRLVRYLDPGILTLYARELPARLRVEQRLVPATPLTTVHLVEHRHPFWGTTLRLDESVDTVPPALVYADLLATGDGRCIETARLIHDRYLARLFPTA